MNFIMDTYERLSQYRFQNKARKIVVQYTVLLCCYGGRLRVKDIVKIRPCSP